MKTKAKTKYLGPDKTHGSRIQVRAMGRQITLPYDYSARDPHLTAVRELCERMGVYTSSITESEDTIAEVERVYYLEVH